MAFTLRNWVIGHHIFECEQAGEDRAEYGQEVLKRLAERLKKNGLKGLAPTNLHHCKQFYLAYPQILQTVSEKIDNTHFRIDLVFYHRILKSMF